MGSEVLLKYGERTGDQVVELFSDIEKSAMVTVGDLLYAGQRQKSRILQRTSQGLDWQGTAFAPYSLSGPIYYYPSAKGNRKAAAQRVARKLGVSRQGSEAAKRTGLGIKFSSYAALKAAFGRSGVDLRGISGPHMLQALVARVNGILSQEEDGSSPRYDRTTASDPVIVLGVYGDEAERASGHQTGTKHLPQRKFLGANAKDQSQMIQDIVERVRFRLGQLLEK